MKKTNAASATRLGTTRPTRRTGVSMPVVLRGVSAGKTTLGGLVMVLKRNQDALEGAQRQQCCNDDQRQPQRRVHPERRTVDDLDCERRKDHDKSGDEHRKEGRSVSRIRERIVEPAPVAPRREREEPLKQLAVAAARAATAYPARDRNLPRRAVGVIIRHRTPARSSIS